VLQPQHVLELSKRVPWTVSSRFEAERQITFGDNSELVVTTGGGSFNSPGDVHGFVIDAKAGTVKREAAWQARAWAYIFGTADGDYAVLTDKGVSLYSPGLLTVLTTAAHEAPTYITPDGQYLAAWEQRPGPHGTIYFLDSRTLKRSGPEFVDKNLESVAPDRLATTVLIVQSHAMEVQILSRQGMIGQFEAGCGEGRPRFLSADLLAVLGCQQIQVATTQGNLLFTAKLEGWLPYLAAVSRNGNRFAVLEQFSRPGDPATLCWERVTVFDVTKRQAIATVALDDLNGMTEGPYASAVALSPDGSRLAVDSRGVLRIYSIGN
jgi:hypothetical protein